MWSTERQSPSSVTRSRRHAGRVLIVSDREICRLALEISLEQQGFDVHGASTHDEACGDEFMGGRYFDVVVLDIRNPAIDPARAVKSLKRTYGSSRVVICSDTVGGAGLGNALAAGAFAFIMQPFDASQMAGFVRMAMDRVPGNDRLALRAW